MDNVRHLPVRREAQPEPGKKNLLERVDVDDAMSLLEEWWSWWDSNHEAPPKMPDALHVRTAIFLMVNQSGKVHPSQIRFEVDQPEGGA